MPEIKHQFTGGKMNKDLDERLIPNGEYRDAMNIQVSTSEGSEVGTVQNVLGNMEGCTYTGPNPILPGSSTIGSISDEKNDTLYWLVAGPNSSQEHLGKTTFSDPVCGKDLIMRKTNAGCEPVFVDKHTVLVQNNLGVSNLPIYQLDRPIACFDAVSNGWSVTAIGPNGYSNTVMINSVTSNSVTFNKPLDIGSLSSKVNGPFVYFHFHRQRVLSFDEDKLITGINIIDDMLLWTDNNTEPKKINIPRSVEGTNPNGHFQTKLVNEYLVPGIGPNASLSVDIKEEHITVVKKAPKRPLALDLQTAREAGKNYTAVMKISSSSIIDNSFVSHPFYQPVAPNNFSSLKVGDTFLVDGLEDLQGNPLNGALPSGLSSVGNLWLANDKIVLKEFDGDSPPSVPIGDNYRIKGLIKHAGNPYFISSGLVEIEITSIVGNPPPPDPTTGILKYAIDPFAESEKLFEFKFPRFSYRYKYEDGEYSTFAPFTDVAFSPGNFDYHPKKGYNLGMTNRITSIILKDFVASDIPLDVIEIDLLYKDDGSPNIYIVNTIKPQDEPIDEDSAQNAWYSTSNLVSVDGTTSYNIPTGVYEITSDTIYASVASNQLLRPWDNVPRKALAQEVTGNRVVYANYVQNYNLTGFSAKFNPSITPSGTTLDRFGRDNIRSIKSLREYQLGVVFVDEYGRETPVLSNPSGTFKLDKTQGEDENRLSVEMGESFSLPNYFKYYKFFIKETSGEYYNLAMDRFYDAADGNFWLAFPSSDRNKIDIDTFLILKKSADSNSLIKEQARYKILAIENEAPDFIKTSRYNIGEAIGVFGDQFTNPPRSGRSEFELFSQQFDQGSAGAMHEITDPLYVEFEDVSTNEISNRYRVTEMNKSDIGGGNDKFYVKLTKPLGDDVTFLLDNRDTPTRIKGSIKTRFFKYIVENTPQFDGRFFVKVYADEVFEQYIELPQKQVEKEYRVITEKSVYYMASDHVERHNAQIFGVGSAVYGGIDPSRDDFFGTIVDQLTNPQNKSWIESINTESLPPSSSQVLFSGITAYRQHSGNGGVFNGPFGGYQAPNVGGVFYGLAEDQPGGWVDATAAASGLSANVWQPTSYIEHTNPNTPSDLARHSALYHNMTPYEVPLGSQTSSISGIPAFDDYEIVKTYHAPSLFDGQTELPSDSLGFVNPAFDPTLSWGDPTYGATKLHTHGGFGAPSSYPDYGRIEGRTPFYVLTQTPAVSSFDGWGVISKQGFPSDNTQTTNRPNDWGDGWGTGEWDGTKWASRQGPDSSFKADEDGNYQTLFGEYNGKTTSAVGWYNIPSTYRDSGAEKLGEYYNDTYGPDLEKIVRKAGFVPIADSLGEQLNTENFTIHGLTPDGDIKQDLYRFIPPTVNDWYYYTAYFAAYKTREIAPKVFVQNPFHYNDNNPNATGSTYKAGDATSELNPVFYDEMKFLDKGAELHTYFDVLGERGDIDSEKENIYEDVWFIDDGRYAGQNSSLQGSWGKNYQNHRASFHNYPHLESDNRTAARDPKGGITKKANSSASMMSLSFGGIDPEKRETQSYYEEAVNLTSNPSGRFEQFEIKGAADESDNFWDIAGVGRNKYTSQVKFVEKFTSGRQFRWKEDPTGTVYTIEAQVIESNRLRYDTNPLNADGKSTGGSFGTNKNYDKRFEELGEPNINAQFPLNIGNRIENFFKNYKISITPELTSASWNPINAGLLGPIDSGRIINKYSSDNGITQADIFAHQGYGNNAFLMDTGVFEASWDTQYEEAAPIVVGMILTHVAGIKLANPLLVSKIQGPQQNLGHYRITIKGYDNNPNNSYFAGVVTSGAALIFKQPLMNGLSVNSAKNITDHNIAFLGMGAVGYNLQFVEAKESEDQILPEDPSIWETEPKESTDLDIYYEISGNNPIKIDSSTVKTAVPLGSTIDGYVVTGYHYDEIVIDSGGVEALRLAGSLTEDHEFKVIRPDGSSFITNIDLVWLSGVLNSNVAIAPDQTIKLKPFLYNSLHTLNWFNCYAWGNGVESNRIRDNFNQPFITNGAKASTTLEDQYKEEHRKYGLIYSGIYNSNSGVNNLNQFIQAESITKDVNPIYGSIQKLHSQSSAEGDLVTLCEDRILKILANKDALFNADGNPQLTAVNRVLGQTIPFSGEFGISKNPESFASEAYRIYFTDRVRGSVMRLSKDGLTPISMFGMKDWFKDNLKLSSKIVGSHDDKKDEYNITLDNTVDEPTLGQTVSFREDIKGWVSFKSFVPESAASMANDYYTFVGGNLFKHHIEDVDRNTFYENDVNVDEPFTSSSINVILNDGPSIVKSFSTLNYEGSQAKVDEFTHRYAITQSIYNTGYNITDGEYYNLEAKPGWHVEAVKTNKEKGSLNEFIEKEGKWFNYLKGQSVITNPEDNHVIINDDGSSSFDQASFAIQGIGTTNSVELIPCIGIQGCTDPSYGNYDPLAICDDGSCVNVISTSVYGCTDCGYLWEQNLSPMPNPLNNLCPGNITGTYSLLPGALNYYFGATIDDESCTYDGLGCTDLLAANYDPLATIDDGSCLTDVTLSYDCDQDVGCFDPGTGNGFFANLGACETFCCANYNQDCGDEPVSTYNCVELFGGGNASCLDPGDGTGVYTGSNALNNCQAAIAANNGGCTPRRGCTDDNASNYDPLATIDDGSCYVALTCGNIFDIGALEGCDDYLCLVSFNAGTSTIACNQSVQLGNFQTPLDLAEYWAGVITDQYNTGASIYVDASGIAIGAIVPDDMLTLLETCCSSVQGSGV